MAQDDRWRNDPYRDRDRDRRRESGGYGPRDYGRGNWASREDDDAATRRDTRGRDSRDRSEEEWFGPGHAAGMTGMPVFGIPGGDPRWDHRGRGGDDRRGYREWRDTDDRGFWDRAADEVSSWFGDEDAERRRRMDERQSHRGRGPRNYTRSDDRIREDVSDRLSDDPYVDASDVEVAVSGGEVTLSGTVDGRTAKRRAEDCAEAVSGVRHVQNNLRVRERSDQGLANASLSQPTTTSRPASGEAAWGSRDRS